MAAGAGVALVLWLILWFGLRLGRVPRPLPMSSALADTAAEPLRGVSVVLDPGHGGEDPGTTSGPLSEAALTYRLAVETAARLRAEGADVVFTVRSRQLDPALARSETAPERPADATLAATGRPLRLRHSPGPLWERAEVARQVWTRQAARDPDAARDVFFLSLHFDQFHAPGVSGGVVCVDRRVPSIPALGVALVDGLGKDGGILRPGDFRGRHGLSGRKLGVLDPAYNPVPERALLEMATLSNPADARLAADPAWRGEMARRITEAVIEVHQGRH